MSISTLAAVSEERAPRLAWLAWSVYLASSWTWCIGMLLPALLERDFGPAGLWVFALPNVAGAAAMAWVLRETGRSTDLFDRHRPAVRVFSLVTVAFHGAFLALIVAPLARVAGVGWLVPILMVLAVVPALAGRERAWSLAAYAVSLACMALWWITGARGTIPEVEVMARSIELSRLPTGHVAPLAAACVFGFALCPYLDGTFHRARQALPEREARRAFAVGFGVLFAAMLAFSAGYAAVFWETYRPGSARPGAWVFDIVLAHLAAQSAVTMALHLRVMGRGRADGESRLNAWNGLAAGGLVVLAVAEAAWPIGPGYPRGLAPPVSERHEWYRAFMAFYGLVFPAYVWLVMIPTWRGGSVTGRHWGVLTFAVLCAAPSFYMGFIEGRTWWLVPGLAAVLACRGLIRRPAA